MVRFVRGVQIGLARSYRLKNLRFMMVAIIEVSGLMVDCVSATVLHPSWSMMATASGSYHFDMQEEDLAVRDYSMKIWVFD